MRNKIVLVNRLLLITFLTSCISIFGMEKLPNELIVSIISHKGQSLENAIKSTLSLKSTCKYLNTSLSLKEIGKACAYYDKAEKNKLMKKLLLSMNDIDYWKKRHAAFLLTYAGADSNACKEATLLSRTVQQEDKDMITVLFENNANPNEKSLLGDPTFFNIKDIAIAKMFIEQGVDVHVGGMDTPNVLWELILRHPFAELIEFYLGHNVDAKKIDNSGDTIFHNMVYCAFNQKSSKECIKIAELLFNTAPELLNIKNNDGETALDIALYRHASVSHDRKVTEALISFFEKCNATEQLKQNNMTVSNQQPECFICCNATDNVMNIPCSNIHPDIICIGCYEKFLKFSKKCPLCRSTLL